MNCLKFRKQYVLRTIANEDFFSHYAECETCRMWYLKQILNWSHETTINLYYPQPET